MGRFYILILIVAMTEISGCSKSHSSDVPDGTNKASDETLKEDNQVDIGAGSGSTNISDATFLDISLAALTKLDPTCAWENLMSGGCRAAIDDACSKQGATFGFGPVEFNPTVVRVVCVKGGSTRLTSEVPACAQINSLQCRSAVRRECIDRKFSSGVPLTKLSGTAMTFACFKGKDLSVNQSEWQILDGIDTELRDRNETLQMVAINRMCMHYGFQAGHGAEEGNEINGDAVVSCFGKAGNPKTLESWWKRVESGAFKIDPTGSPQAQIISFGLNAPRFTRLLPSGIALGRELHPAQDRWSVASYKFSREGDIYKWQEIGRIIDTASNSPSGMFYSAYDPSVTYFQGKHYLAFECAGAGVGPTVGVCMSEIDINGKPTTTVVVQVLSVTDGADRLSASVPKLFVHRGSLYLAWTQVRLNATTKAFSAITVRAAKLADATQEFNIGTAPRLLSNQGFLLMAKTDGMADVMDIVSTGQWIYVIFAQGPPGCLTPLDPVPGCYDLHVSRTKNLDASSNADLLNSAHVLAPNYPQEYGFFFRQPDGTLSIGVQFVGADPSKHAYIYRVVPLHP